ncbi:recombinase family protein [Loktanella sp. Alg231-35]|uniref:recombinase family protein n=1 Tax=Loktanella sp. Alg231-35 TaxID=1922220 RepID=UPI000D55BFC7|nr:recombinase family protein [Loktanella sp. Alg231-35]
MKHYYGYTRVSTVKQGDGVSLEAQQDAIKAYADKQNLLISGWFEEKETAAKSGRPVFNKLISSLRQGEADGVVIHKIDRSARNFSDWALIGELIDSGIDVRFAHESLDMQSRGGRLTADIQAVIAADYVRNLREECIKGIEGRLKQGLYPFNAPIGYMDQGAGKPKIPDPVRAPYVRQAFELYASGEFSILGLLEELRARGMRTRRGGQISKGCLENLLFNPFYHGVIHIKRGNRTYKGIHEPLIEKALFDRVQIMKSDRCNKKHNKHEVMFRRLVDCGYCGCRLYGEVQKGHIYMRCHTSGCPTTTVRQDVLDAEIELSLAGMQIPDTDLRRLRKQLENMFARRTHAQDQRAVALQIQNIDKRQDRLTEALIDGLIDQNTFQERKVRLTGEREKLELTITEMGDITRERAIAEKFLELTKSLYLIYQMSDPGKKRRLAEIVFSNLTLTGKNLVLTPRNWCVKVDQTLNLICGAPDRDTLRTREEIEEVFQVVDL